MIIQQHSLMHKCCHRWAHRRCCGDITRDKGRLLQLDGKKIHDLTQWFQCLRSILFCPEQIDIIRGAPDVRRKILG